MKRVFKKAWIGLLGTAIIVIGACCSHRNSPEVKDIKARIAELQENLKVREMSCVYGPPEMIREYGRKTEEMRHELDSLQAELEKMQKK